VKDDVPDVRLGLVYLKTVAVTLLAVTMLALHAFGLLFWIVGPLLFHLPWGIAVLTSFAAIAFGQALTTLLRWYNRKIGPEVRAARQALGLDPPDTRRSSDPQGLGPTEAASTADDNAELLASALGPRFLSTAMILYRALAVIGLGGMALFVYGFGQSLILFVRKSPAPALSYAEGIVGALIVCVAGVSLFRLQSRLSDRLSRFTRQASPWGPSPATSDRLWRAWRPMQRSRPWAKRPRNPADGM
jgi:hypothetical protein